MSEKIDLTLQDWETKLTAWLAPKNDSVNKGSYKAIKLVLGNISKVKSKKSRQRLIQVFSLLNVVKHVYFRYSKLGKHALSKSPHMGLYNDHRITDKGGLLSSNKISLASFVNGSITSISTGLF